MIGYFDFFEINLPRLLVQILIPRIMRTSFLIFLMIAATMNALSQKKPSFIRTMPKTGQGYLILEATPSVDYWTIHITKRSYNNDQVTDQIVERHELRDKNYLRIPAE